MEELRIISTACYRNGAFEVNGEARAVANEDVDVGLANAWVALGAIYDRFYRADRISRLVLLCGEALLSGLPSPHLERASTLAPGEGTDDSLKEHTGMVLMG